MAKPFTLRIQYAMIWYGMIWYDMILTNISAYSSFYLSVCLSIYLSVCLSIYLSVCLSIYLSMYIHIIIDIICMYNINIISIWIPNIARSSRGQEYSRILDRSQVTQSLFWALNEKVYKCFNSFNRYLQTASRKLYALTAPVAYSLLCLLLFSFTLNTLLQWVHTSFKELDTEKIKNLQCCNCLCQTSFGPMENKVARTKI